MTLQRIEHPAEVSVADSIADMEARFLQAGRQRELIADYIKKRLDPDKHTYKVPGSNKPSLNKEGAEIVAMPFGLKARYDQTGGPSEPPDDANRPYQITVKCQLFNARGDAGEGLGSASSFITKRDGTHKARQNDPGLCHNATLKMAQKSAYISAVLSSTAASEFFTQDMEDAVGSEQPETAETAERGLCPVHKVPFLHRTGTSKGTGKQYDFWACPEKAAGGGYCQEKPQDKPAPDAKTPDAAPANAQAPIEGKARRAGTPEEKLLLDAFLSETIKLTWGDKQRGEYLKGIFPNAAGWKALTIEQKREAVERLKPAPAPAEDRTFEDMARDEEAGEV